MRSHAHVLVRAAIDAALPALLLLALALLATRPAGEGAGLAAALLFALAFTAFALAGGAARARRGVPPLMARVLLCLGTLACIGAASAPGLPGGERVFEAGLFAACASAFVLFFTALIGRAPTLRDEEW